MRKPAPRLYRLDGCGLDAYDPAALVFEALGPMSPGEQLCLLIEREPFPLYRLLSNQSYAYCARVREDGLYEVTIWHCGQLPEIPVKRTRFALAV